MIDHEIVVHVDSANGGFSTPSNPTAPTPSVETSVAPDKETKTSTISAQSVISAVKNPIGTAFGKLTSAVPWVVAVVAVANVANNIATTSLNMISTATGDSSGEMAYSNFKIGFGHVMNPVSYGMALWKQQLEVDRQNKSMAQQRILLGNGDVNGIAKVGV
jgi:hypothetical protein